MLPALSRDVTAARGDGVPTLGGLIGGIDRIGGVVPGKIRVGCLGPWWAMRGN